MRTVKPVPHATAMINPHSVQQRPSRLPLWVQRAMVGIFVVLLVASGGWSLFSHWRRAAFTLGLAMGWLALTRLTCDDRTIGLVSVRSRRFDVTFCLAISAAMMALAGSVDALGS